VDIKQPTIETVAIAKLKPWPKNPRVQHAVEGIAASIERFGYLSPIIVQAKTYRVLSGHGRLKALKKKKVKSVPVIVTEITDRNADLFTLADNKLNDRSSFDLGMTADLLKGLGKLDFKVTGFGEDELQKLLGAEEPKEEDRRKITFYAGSRDARTLLVTFASDEQYEFVTKAIKTLRKGNAKSVGDVVYNIFKKTK
jgi:ParB-like chromosome segregation protein Spo0J